MTTTTAAGLRDAIENGHTTNQEIAEFTGLNVGHVQRKTKAAVESGELDREKQGHSWHYFVPEEPEQGDPETNGQEAPESSTPPASEATANGDGRMPVIRNYDWDKEVPTEEETYEYIPTDGEWDEINALVDSREYIEDFEPAFAIGGPTGCGKTTLAEWLAHERDWPFFEIQMRYSMREKDIIGAPSISGGDTIWADGTLTKAVMASADRPVVLLLDEINRARPEAKNLLFSALDHRCRVRLDGPRGGEIIEGNRQNLIVIATFNEGREFQGLQKMDAAEQRRYGNQYRVDYLGLKYPGEEADLVAERAKVPTMYAEALVEVSNLIRRSDDVSKGVPTATTIKWGQTAHALSKAGVENAAVRAAQSTIISAYDGQEATTVREIVSSKVDGLPLNEEEIEMFNEDEAVVCDACGFECGRSQAEERGLLATMECPDCESEDEFLRPVER